MTDAPTPPKPQAITLVDSRKVSCDGGGGALGHPLVWYEIGKQDYIDCKYCDRRFVLKGGRADSSLR